MSRFAAEPVLAAKPLGQHEEMINRTAALISVNAKR